MTRAIKRGGVTVLMLLMFILGCQESHDIELGKIQALENQLDSTVEYMELDAEKLADRADIIDLDLQVLKKYYTDTITQEFGNKMDRYKQIRKIYRAYVAKHGWMKTEYTELKKQLQDLRSSVNNEEISHEQFVTYLATESADVATLYEESKLRARMVQRVEPEYIRITEMVEPIINKLRQEFDVVNTLYEGVETR